MKALLLLVAVGCLSTTSTACSKSGGDDEVSNEVRESCERAERVWVDRLANRHLEYEGTEKTDGAMDEVRTFYRGKVQYSRFRELCHADGPPDVDCLAWKNRRQKRCFDAVMEMASKFDYYQPDMSLSEWTEFTLYGTRPKPKDTEAEAPAAPAEGSQPD